MKWEELEGLSIFYKERILTEWDSSLSSSLADYAAENTAGMHGAVGELVEEENSLHILKIMGCCPFSFIPKLQILVPSLLLLVWSYAWQNAYYW